nr:MAG TPA: hypothetical protein [Caudoviricetes sp.]
MTQRLYLRKSKNLFCLVSYILYKIRDRKFKKGLDKSRKM